MQRRKFLKKNILIGSIICIEPSITFGHTPELIRVVLDEELGYYNKVIAQRYLERLTLILGETMRFVENDRLKPETMKVDAYPVHEIIISTFWNYGAAFSNLHSETGHHPNEVIVAVLYEAPITICTNKFSPSSWQSFLSQSPMLPLKIGIPANDRMSEKVSQSLIQTFGLNVEKMIKFHSGSQLMPALIGSQISMSIAPLSVHRVSGKPGGFTTAIKSHRNGNLNVIAIARSKRMHEMPEILTLNEILGTSNHKAILTTVVKYIGPGNESLFQRMKLAAT